MSHILPDSTHKALHRGCVIPAHPLALTSNRSFDERRQRAISRYYIAAGAGGLAVGVHTTQFEIRKPEIGLYEPVLALAIDVMEQEASDDFIRVAGICGSTKQATTEAAMAKSLGYHAGLLSLAALKKATEDELISHCKAVADIIPVFGFYLQPAVGGRLLSYDFWRRFVELENMVAIKIATFNRYQTLDVIRAIAEAGKTQEIALYTGNDDNIVMDLLTVHTFQTQRKLEEIRFKGGLLGHWAIWTHQAVKRLHLYQKAVESNRPIPQHLLTEAIQITDCNAAFFDPANNFSGCIAGIHEVLRRQGLLDGIWCLNPDEMLSPGQGEEIDRVYQAYPHLNDDPFVSEHLDEWMR